MVKTGKKQDVGRPSGPEKATLNISILKTRKKKLQKLAIDKGESASFLIEKALETAYDI